jgi:hypothetical protein
MRKKRTAQRPRSRRTQVTSYAITPAAWNMLRSFVFQPQNGQPLACAECLALEKRADHFDDENRMLILLVATAWRQTYPDAPTECVVSL